MVSTGLTVVRPAGVEDMMGIRGEADVQHAPADVTGLHRPLQVEASPGGVVQADVLVFMRQRRKITAPQKASQLKARDQSPFEYKPNQK